MMDGEENVTPEVVEATEVAAATSEETPAETTAETAEAATEETPAAE